MAVVRNDTVKIGFDVDMRQFTVMTEALDGLKKLLSGIIDNDAFDKLKRNVKQTDEKLSDLKKTAESVNSEGIDDTAEGLKEVKSEGQRAHDKLQKIARTGFDKTISGLKKMGSLLGKVAIKAGKALLKSTALAAAGVGVLVTGAVKGYSEYEQLIGGVDTLFGAGGQSVEDFTASIGKSTAEIKAFQRANGLAVDGIIGPKTQAAIRKQYKAMSEASGMVQANANNAYKTAGLSANDYMETVTSFSASLISSLGGDTAKAAELADMAIIDMADNANKMGSDMGSIQDAYQGFAKQNYTMLDNLKLGYGGTQEEMKRLLKDAEELTGQKYNLSSYSDIVEAIHAVQESMGITGTTAVEADKTISGSLSSLKAAWGNTLTSLVVGGDAFDQCVDNLVDSAKTFGKNIMPAITRALTGVGGLVEELSPIIARELPGMIRELLPSLIKGATALLKGIIIALPDIIKTIAAEIPTIFSELWSGFREAFGDLPGLDLLENFFGKLSKLISGNADKLKKLVPLALSIVAAFKLFNKLKGIASLFGGKDGKGGKGGGILDGFTRLANLKPTVILKGLINLAIILGGLGILAAAIMAVSPYMAQLSDFKSIGEVLVVIGAVGLMGAGLTKLAGSVGNIPVSTVAKGLASIAIVMVGLGALAALVMWVAPYMAGLCDMGTLAQTVIVIGAVGVIGALLAGLAGIIGVIPFTAVLKGLGSIATAIAAVTGIIAAFGALAQIEGYTEFMASGGDALKQVFTIIGECAGAVVGGFAEGVTASLPEVGSNLAAFGENVAPLFRAFSGIDFTGFNDFTGAFSRFVLLMTGEKILGMITGGVDYASLGTQLTTFATNASGFFATVADIPEQAFANTTALFSALASVSDLPKEGGIMGWFAGEQTAALTTLTTQLPVLGTGVAAFFTSLGSVTDFTPISSMFSALASVSDLPKDGGIMGWFTGNSTAGLTSVASQLPGVASHIAAFFLNLGDRTDFTPIANLFNTLGSINIDASAADKGIFGWGTSQFEALGTGLSNFATNAATFFSTIDALSTENLSSFFTTVGGASSLPTALAGIDGELGAALTNMVTTIQVGMATAKAALATALTAMVSAITGKYASFQTAGGMIMNGLRAGMLAKKATLVATAASMAYAIQKAFNVSLDIHSPSRVMMESGANVGAGVVEGMRRTFPAIRDTAQGMGATTRRAYNDYAPSGSTSNTYNNYGGSTTSVAPVFNLTISGSQDDRVLARRVKSYVSEAIRDTFDSLDRKMGDVREA